MFFLASPLEFEPLHMSEFLVLCGIFTYSFLAVSWLLFIFVVWFQYDKFKEIFLLWLNLPLKNKVSLFFFIIFLAIPAKVYINNKIGLFAKFIVWLFLLFFAELYPVVYILIFIKVMFIIDVYLFLIFYLDFKKSNAFINNHFFNNDLEFANYFITFFFGNPTK